jgi:hypothetical protein
MPTKADSFYAEFEWEGIQSPLRITRLDHGGNLLKGSATTVVERDESYHLRCAVQGFSDDPFGPTMEMQNLPFTEFAFSGDTKGRLARLSHCFINGMDSNMDCDSGTYRNNTFVINVHTGLIEQNTRGKWSEIAHTDWFLNGPHGSVFTESSKREQSQAFSRSIEKLAGYVFQTKQGPGGGVSFDCVVVPLADFCFVVRRVPQEFGPSWTQKLAIDYSKKFSSIPAEETREAIAELVSFVFGRRLIDIGDTTFGEDDIPFLLRSWNPRGINIRMLCSKIDFPPCAIDPHQNKPILNVANLLQTLAPRYLKLRRVLNLDHALWRYWTFQEMPLGINLPMIANALEILALAWFESNFSASGGKFVSGRFFNELLAADFKSITAKLTEAAKKDGPARGLSDPKALQAVMTRLGDSFLMGWSSRMNQFFMELGIVLSEKEKAALKARNQQTHSSADGDRPDDLWENGELLRTVFYKVMLRLLDYSGEYLDYGVRHPEPKKLSPAREHNDAYRAVVYG